MAASLRWSAFGPDTLAVGDGADPGPPGFPGPRRALARVLAAASAGLVLLAGSLVVPSGAPHPVAFAASNELAAAEASYAAALAAQSVAGERLDEARRVAVETEHGLRAMTEHQQALVLAQEAMLSRAREMAVAAYVRGGTQADLHAYLDASLANEAILRIHLAVGRVDRAKEAAAELRSARQQADEEVLAHARAVADAVAELAAAEADATEADRQMTQAYDALVAATRAADAEAARLAAAARAREQAAAQEADAAATAAAAEQDQADQDQAAAEVTSGNDAGAAPPPRAVPAPAEPVGSEDAWARLRECESGGNYAAVSANGLYRGAYQFAQETWEGVGGTGDPAAAPPEEQDLRARLLYERSGPGQWPLCGRHLP